MYVVIRSGVLVNTVTGHAMQIYNCLHCIDNCKFAEHGLLLCLASPLVIRATSEQLITEPFAKASSNILLRSS